MAAPRDAAGAAGDLDRLLHVEDIDGREIDLGRDLADGRPVVLVFWQAWCQPCLREAPSIAAAHRQLSSSLRFVGVVSGPNDVVDEPAVRAAVLRLGLGYPQVRDRDLTLTRHFEVEATPTIVVLDPSGNVAYQGHHAPQEWDQFLTPSAR